MEMGGNEVINRRHNEGLLKRVWITLVAFVTSLVVGLWLTLIGPKRFNLNDTDWLCGETGLGVGLDNKTGGNYTAPVFCS